MTCTVGPVSAIVIDVIHPGVRATGSSVLALFQNLFGLAAGPFIAGGCRTRGWNHQRPRPLLRACSSVLGLAEPTSCAVHHGQL